MRYLNYYADKRTIALKSAGYRPRLIYFLSRKTTDIFNILSYFKNSFNSTHGCHFFWKPGKQGISENLILYVKARKMLVINFNF